MEDPVRKKVRELIAKAKATPEDDSAPRATLSNTLTHTNTLAKMIKTPEQARIFMALLKSYG